MTYSFYAIIGILIAVFLEDIWISDVGRARLWILITWKGVGFVGQATIVLPTWAELFLVVLLCHHLSQRTARVIQWNFSWFALDLSVTWWLFHVEANCTYTTNDMGECGCNQQFFINEDCDQAFYCSTSATEGQDGCSKQCSDGEVRSLTIMFNCIWHQ